MSRQGEVDRIYDIFDNHYWDTFNHDKLCLMEHMNFLAQYLVDHGIRSKGGFESEVGGCCDVIAINYEEVEDEI